MSKNTLSGLEENVASALSYVLGPLTGIAFLVIEKENKTVRFHAMQSLIYFGILAVLNIFLGLFSGVLILGFFVNLVLWMLSIVWLGSLIYLAYSAYQGKMYKIPYIGESVWTQINK